MKKSKANQYVGIDVHDATMVMEFQDAQGRVLQKTTIPTSRTAVVNVLKNVNARLHVAFEEGTQAQWLHDIISPIVHRVVVCNPRASRAGTPKNDQIDAHLLAEALREGKLKPVFHASGGVRVLKELVRAYETTIKIGTRCKNQLKALFRGQAISTKGKEIYTEEDAKEMIPLLPNPGARLRAEQLLAQIVLNTKLREKVLEEIEKEAKKHPAYRILIDLPHYGPVRTAQLIAIIVTPHRFPGKRQIWAMAGLAVIHQSSADQKVVGGRIVRSKRRPMTRGLNRNHNSTLKAIFKSTAQSASARPGPLKEFYDEMVERGMDPEMATLTLARKIAAYTLRLWKTGGKFDPALLTKQTT